MLPDPAPIPATAAPAAPDPFATAHAILGEIRSRLGTIFVGHEALVEMLLAAVLARGHVLVESVPGLGKTLLVKAIGQLLGLRTGRIQFTPDLMPSDITGSHIFDLAERRFVFREGPVFTQYLLADEFNRSPAKTHAALLEAMQERQVTLDGTRHPLPKPFLVLATQNPIENEGTYNLPEAQLDRFLFKVVLDYPGEAEERRILGLHLEGGSPEHSLTALGALLDPHRLDTVQELTTQVRVDPSLVDYILAIVRRSRGFPGLHLGASPRAGVALLAGSRALALLRGRGYVVPDDVADAAKPALRHRIILSPEAEVEGRRPDDLVAEILKAVPVPRGTGGTLRTTDGR